MHDDNIAIDKEHRFSPDGITPNHRASWYARLRDDYEEEDVDVDLIGTVTGVRCNTDWGCEGDGAITADDCGRYLVVLYDPGPGDETRQTYDTIEETRRAIVDGIDDEYRHVSKVLDLETGVDLVYETSVVFPGID